MVKMFMMMIVDDGGGSDGDGSVAWIVKKKKLKGTGEKSPIH